MIDQGQQRPAHRIQGLSHPLYLWTGVHWDHKTQFPHPTGGTWEALQARAAGKIIRRETCAAPMKFNSRTPKCCQPHQTIMYACTERLMRWTNISIQQLQQEESLKVHKAWFPPLSHTKILPQSRTNQESSPQTGQSRNFPGEGLNQDSAAWTNQQEPNTK